MVLGCSAKGEGKDYDNQENQRRLLELSRRRRGRCSYCEIVLTPLRLKVNLVLIVSHTLSHPSFFPPPEFLNVKSFSFETRIQPEKNMKFKMLQLKFHFLCPNKEINWSQWQWRVTIWGFLCLPLHDPSGMSDPAEKLSPLAKSIWQTFLPQRI